MSSRTRPEPPRSWSPVDTTMASDLVRSCSFLKVGTGYWVGGITAPDGRTWDVVETPSAWELRLVGDQVKPGDVAVTKGSTLELAIEKAVGRPVTR
jgi:hypothetical protein